MSLCRRVNGFLEREIDGEVLLLDTESNQIHQLNTTASFIWRKCQEGASAPEIARMVAEDFDVEETIAQSDVDRIVDRFKALRMIK